MSQRKRLDKIRAKSSRGYNGYFKGHYLRSLKEYMFAEFLEHKKKEYKGLTYSVEDKIYQISDLSYKPDFFIYSFGVLKAIVEIKDPSAKKEALAYQQAFTKYFNNMGLHYVVIFKDKHFNKMNRISNMTEQSIKKWRQSSVYDCIGRHNAHYGFKHSKESLTLIGIQTKKRFQKKEYRERHSKKMKEVMSDPEIRKNLSLKQKAVQAIRNPKHTVVCPYCGKSLIIGNGAYKQHWENNPLKGCSTQCTKKLKEKNGTVYKKGVDVEHKSLRKRLQREVKLINNLSEDSIKKAKRDGVIHNNSPLSISTLKKYFNSIDKETILNESI